ncbi:MAG: hypothetical protein AB7K09_12660 [Planctomycetota bacterium]
MTDAGPAGPTAPATAAPATADPRTRAARTMLVLALLVVVAALLLWFRCATPVLPFDWFRYQAGELENDPAAVVAFVRDQVKTLPYRGNVKGALGTLWHAAGSPEEKVQLVNALLAHCPGAIPADAAAFSTIAPDRDAATDGSPDAAMQFSLMIAHRKRTASGGIEDMPLAEISIGDLIGNVHSVEVTSDTATTITLRARTGDVTTTVPTKGATGESLIWRIGAPGELDGEEVTRELWQAGNTVGPDRALPGDRHDFVVLPCRVTRLVREKEELRLTQRGRLRDADATAYLTLLDWAVQHDEMLARVEAQLGVTALYSQPRIIVWSTVGKALGALVSAIDLRHDYTAFTGERVDSYHAAQIRSLVASGMEHHFLEQETGAPGTSAYDMFGRLIDEVPDSVDRRRNAIRAALRALLRDGGADATATFRARMPAGSTVAPPAVTVTRAGRGALRVVGGAVTTSFREQLAAHPDALPFALGETGTLDRAFEQIDDAAVAIESLLAGADVTPRVSPGFVLDIDLQTGAAPLVVNGARLHFAWGDGDSRVEQRITIDGSSAGELGYSFDVRTGLLSARGRRSIGAAAVQSATVHNPNYRNGESRQDDATSLVVSRRVAAALRNGESIDFSMQATHGLHDDPLAPRPIAWSGQLRGAGKGEVTVPVNGKPVMLPIIRATGADNELTIIDDARWPVGMAAQLQDVHTGIRLRVMDEQGVGIGNALINIGDLGDEGVPTRPDGRIRIAPLHPMMDSTAVKVLILQAHAHESERQTVTLDLSTIGLDEAVLQVPRWRPRFRWIGPALAAELDTLPISEQTRRHARAELDRDRLLIMPDSPLVTDVGALYGFYSYDPRTGHVIGMTEDGLHGGAMIDWSRYRDAAKSAGSDIHDASSDPASLAASPLHVMRGVNTAMWVFAAYRLEESNVDTVLDRMVAEMDQWEAATNLFEQVEGVAGSKAREKLAEKVNEALPGADSAAAKAAFKIGYLGALMFMEHRQGGDS